MHVCCMIPVVLLGDPVFDAMWRVWPRLMNAEFPFLIRVVVIAASSSTLSHGHAVSAVAADVLSMRYLLDDGKV